MEKGLYSILGMLTAQFVLGMSLNLIGRPGPGSLMTIVWIILILHALLAIGLIVNAVKTAKLSSSAVPPIQRQVRRGFGSLLLAFLSGLMTLSPFAKDFFSFVMAVGFMMAFVFYGLALVGVNSAHANPKA
jgi:hypothetical protein